MKKGSLIDLENWVALIRYRCVNPTSDSTRYISMKTVSHITGLKEHICDRLIRSKFDRDKSARMRIVSRKKVGNYTSFSTVKYPRKVSDEMIEYFTKKEIV